MKDSFISRFLRYLLYFVFVTGVLITISIPWMISFYLSTFYDAYSVVSDYKLFLTVFLMMAGTMGLWIVLELILLLRTIPSDPFSRRNSSALKRIGIAGLLTGVLFFAKTFIYFTVLTFVCGAVLCVCGVFSLVLHDLFKQAVKYKEENDLTI